MLNDAVGCSTRGFSFWNVPSPNSQALKVYPSFGVTVMDMSSPVLNGTVVGKSIACNVMLCRLIFTTTYPSPAPVVDRVKFRTVPVGVGVGEAEGDVVVPVPVKYAAMEPTPTMPANATITASILLAALTLFMMFRVFVFFTSSRYFMSSRTTSLF